MAPCMRKGLRQLPDSRGTVWADANLHAVKTMKDFKCHFDGPSGACVAGPFDGMFCQEAFSLLLHLSPSLSYSEWHRRERTLGSHKFQAAQGARGGPTFRQYQCGRVPDQKGTSHTQWYSEKLLCLVALACSTASFWPRTPTWHTPQRSVKLPTSVNCRASCACRVDEADCRQAGSAAYANCSTQPQHQQVQAGALVALCGAAWCWQTVATLAQPLRGYLVLAQLQHTHTTPFIHVWRRKVSSSIKLMSVEVVHTSIL